MQIKKKNLKLSPFSDSMILHVENHKECTKLLKLINNFSKFVRYKINIKNSLYIYVLALNYKNMKIENNSIYKGIKRIKHFVINLTKKAQDLYTENYRILLKEL